MEAHCLDLEEVDEELSDLGAESNAVEDRGAREGSQREDQCVRRRTKFFIEAIKKTFLQKQENESEAGFGEVVETDECWSALHNWTINEPTRGVDPFSVS